MAAKAEPLFTGSNWDFDTLWRAYEAIEKVALDDLGLDVYPNQIEIISSEQMLDAYSSVGMPLMYQHWSFGKHFARDEKLYRKGQRGLAYEIVINSNPCISYNMEENTMAMQALVMAHAAFGHNHFFKNNYLFKQWTDADGILDYMEFAKGFIAKCEEREGPEEVERILDAAHALMNHGVFRYRRPVKPSERAARERERRRREYDEKTVNALWRTVPGGRDSRPARTRQTEQRKAGLNLPEENLLHFIETHSPALEPWQADILNIVRVLAQYFYPQKQTKMMNEGCACFVHYHILTTLYDHGLLDDGAMLEILHMHTNVLAQPDFDAPRYGGINPYALGFAMMRDIRRICIDPTAEDRAWFPDFAGSGDWRAVLREAWANYRDESFIRQFLSPKVMRDFRLFAIADNTEEPFVTVSSIHDDQGFLEIRRILAEHYDLAANEPDIQVVDVDLLGDRHLYLRHKRRNGVALDKKTADQVLAHLRTLWGYDVSLTAV